LFKLPSTPKLRRFGLVQNDIVLHFMFFFFLKKKRKLKKKKKKGKSGWLEPPPSQKWGGRTTPFLAKGWLRPPHTGRMGVAKATPGLWGWSGHPKRPKKERKKWVLAFGGGRTTPKGMEVAKSTTYGRQGVASDTPGPRGWSGHPQRPKRILSFFFFFWAFWGGRTTPKGLGWLRPPHTAGMGWPKPPLGDHPIFGKGVAPATPIYLFFFFFFFNFLLFFKKKKN
jgi:hypothetical protein